MAAAITAPGRTGRREWSICLGSLRDPFEATENRTDHILANLSEYLRQATRSSRNENSYHQREILWKITAMELRRHLMQGYRACAWLVQSKGECKGNENGTRSPPPYPLEALFQRAVPFILIRGSLNDGCDAVTDADPVRIGLSDNTPTD
jgi:hypothetical protein